MPIEMHLVRQYAIPRLGAHLEVLLRFPIWENRSSSEQYPFGTADDLSSYVHLLGRNNTELLTPIDRVSTQQCKCCNARVTYRDF